MLTDWNLRALFVAVMATTYIVTSAQFVKRLHATLLESLRRRYQVETLAADLRVQKELAEQASQAKSRFLAAASHDLRQPVHALGLFVGALRPAPADDESRRLLGHVQGTVDAMGTMFDALLDVSRLDAGMVPMAERVPGAAAAAAAHADDEGRAGAGTRACALRLNARRAGRAQRPGAARAHAAQPGRSTRCNYTDRGGVLLAPRVRGGAVAAAGADTGIGIAPERQAEVFQEFVQLHNPERDRAQGLGLGLAIVRRLAGLLEVPLALHSRAGPRHLLHAALPRRRWRRSSPTPPAAPGRAAGHGRAAATWCWWSTTMPRSAARWPICWPAGGYACIAAAGMAELQPQLMALTRRRGWRSATTGCAATRPGWRWPGSCRRCSTTSCRSS